MQTKRAFLLTELEAQIKRFDKDSVAHKRLYRAMRYSVFILTALTASLASVAVAYPNYQAKISLAIVFLTSLAGIVTSIEGLRKPSELWIHERTTHYALRDLKRQVEYEPEEQQSTVLLDERFARLQSILGAAGDKWQRNIAGGPKAGQKVDDGTKPDP